MVTQELILQSFPVIKKTLEELNVEYVIVGGTSALLQNVDIITHDVDLFMLVDTQIYSVELIKKRLSEIYECKWHHDGGYWDSHANHIAGLNYDFRLIEVYKSIYKDFLQNRAILNIKGEKIIVRILQSLIFDAYDSADNAMNYGENRLQRRQHYLDRAKILEQCLKK